MVISTFRQISKKISASINDVSWRFPAISRRKFWGIFLNSTSKQVFDWCSFCLLRIEPSTTINFDKCRCSATLTWPEIWITYTKLSMSVQQGCQFCFHFFCSFNFWICECCAVSGRKFCFWLEGDGSYWKNSRSGSSDFRNSILSVTSLCCTKEMPLEKQSSNQNKLPARFRDKLYVHHVARRFNKSILWPFRALL